MVNNSPAATMIQETAASAEPGEADLAAGQKATLAKIRKHETNNNVTATTRAVPVPALNGLEATSPPPDRTDKDVDLTSSSSSVSSGGGGAASISSGSSGTGMQDSTCCALPSSGASTEVGKELDANEEAGKIPEEVAGEQNIKSFEEKALHSSPEKRVELDTNKSLLVNGNSLSTTPIANGFHQYSNHHHQHRDIEAKNHQDVKLIPLLESSSPAAPAKPGICHKQKQLTYLQVLLIRKWPYLALTICIMGALIFGILLSGLTVLLMHGQSSDCLSAALRSGRLMASAKSAHIGSSESASSLSSSSDFAALEHSGAASSPLLASREFESPMSELMMSSHLSPGADLSSAPGAGVVPPHVGLELDNLRAKSAATVSSQQAQSSRFQRLPTSIWPIHYDLFVQPYLYEPFNFTGKVLIRIKCTEATDNITLHALDLDLNSTTITLEELQSTPAVHEQPGSRLATDQPTGKPKVSSLSQDKQLQHSIIRLDGQLQPGKEYLLGIDFVGFLNDDLAGFYKIKYELKNSTATPTTTWIAATQFQATDARRAFPCFDEPLYKATFSIKIKHWKNMTSLSNMPIVERQDSEDGRWVTDVFEKSHRMSTYLVAFAVTNFESRSDGNISVWTRPGFAHTAEYSLRIARKLLHYYEDFFGIEYPLPKMDMIALPDFNAGAMENWGLITYRETSMLFDESGSSIANKQRIATVVAHELAHQWFGNLVTPKWWDDLWLNEGFASYVEYIGVDEIEPSWKILDQFVTEEIQNVFRVDDLSSSHQISIPVNDPEEISEIFDHISYAKSASVIRMMHHFLTPEVFKTGLRRYLRALKYSNAEQSDLWAHLTEASRLIRANNRSSSGEPVDVGKVMNSWTLQVGYPLVTLTRQYDGSRRAQIDQIRYRPTLEQQQQQVQALRNGSQTAQKWEVPITFTWKSERNFDPITRLWLHQNDSGPVELSKEILPESDDDWMLVNLGQVGYYRVNYDPKNWRLLLKQLNEDHQAIGTRNRAQLLDDIFQLARSGSLDYKFALDSTNYLKNERDFLPWDSVLTAFSYIDDMLVRTPLYGKWQDYVADLIRPHYSRYKDSEHWTIRAASNESQSNALDQYCLVTAISWACQVDQHCISKAKGLFRTWRETGKNEINPVVRFTVYCTAIENGDKDDWEFLWRAYEKEQNSSERDRILKSLSCSKQMWILSRYLEWTFNKSKPIRRQDGAYIFRMISKNNYGRDLAFNFVRERWSTIREHYGKTSFSLGALIRSLSYAMNTQIELNQLMNFYESVKSDVGTGRRSFQNAIEEVETNVQWRNRSYKILEDWISARNGSRSL